MKMGRPAKYESPTDLKEAVDQYFGSTDKPTMGGLSAALGFKDRHNFRQQKIRGPEYADVVLYVEIRMLIFRYGEAWVKAMCKDVGLT